MLKQGLSIETTFYPPQFSLDSTFNILSPSILTSAHISLNIVPQQAGSHRLARATLITASRTVARVFDHKINLIKYKFQDIMIRVSKTSYELINIGQV